MKHLLTFLICIIITSCTKKGDPGETGPAGSNGTNGPMEMQMLRRII